MSDYFKEFNIFYTFITSLVLITYIMGGALLFNKIEQPHMLKTCAETQDLLKVGSFTFWMKKIGHRNDWFCTSKIENAPIRIAPFGSNT